MAGKLSDIRISYSFASLAIVDYRASLDFFLELLLGTKFSTVRVGISVSLNLNLNCVYMHCFQFFLEFPPDPKFIVLSGERGRPISSLLANSAMSISATFCIARFNYCS